MIKSFHITLIDEIYINFSNFNLKINIINFNSTNILRL